MALFRIMVKNLKMEYILIGGNIFFGAKGNIYRHREGERGGDLGGFSVSKLKMQSFHVALRLLSPCSYVALLQLY